MVDNNSHEYFLKYIDAQSSLNAIENILNYQEVPELALSDPIVKRVHELVFSLRGFKREILDGPK